MTSETKGCIILAGMFLVFVVLMTLVIGLVYN